MRLRRAVVVLGVAVLLVGVLEERSFPPLPPAPIHTSDERKGLLPEDFLWMQRHERQSRECRGQQYVAHCCADARTDLTCIEFDLKGR